jgi:hypothetical protein
LSVASFELFPFFALHRREPVGQRLCGAFFCFRFLAKQEKGVAAGLPPASNRPATTEVETRPSNSKPKTACRQRAYSMRLAGLCCLKKRMGYAPWLCGLAANRIPFGAACVRLRCANRTYAGLRRRASRMTDVLTCAFRMWRCRLCWAENGFERFVFERSEFRTFPIF